MSSRPYLHMTPRARSDIKRCLRDMRRQSSARPLVWALGILSGIARAHMDPTANCIAARRSLPDIELRRSRASRFTVIYAYLPPNAEYPRGVVSIRAVRHSRVKEDLAGAKEPSAGAQEADSRGAKSMQPA